MEVKSNEVNRVGWQSPSNIALVKYWGKHGIQLPDNPSVSFTLSTAVTETIVQWEEKVPSDEIEMVFLFEGAEQPKFADRIKKHLTFLSKEQLPFLRNISLKIESKNSFPHSSGIASSASGMSALALCLCEIENMLNGKVQSNQDFIRRASNIARLGSGSACRSVLPFMGLWGHHSDIVGSSDEYAIGIQDEVHPIFNTFHDDILIVSAGEKSVSSTVGHKLMETNPFAKARYQQANERIIELLSALKSGDIPKFGKITEDEALTLHALMMCSDPSFILMEENSLSIINKIREFRMDTGLQVYFTLDAGPNVHVLYPESDKFKVHDFIQGELKQHCHNGRIIEDKVGQGPMKLF